MDAFFNSYRNYVGFPIRFFIGVFFQLDYEYRHYVSNIYGEHMDETEDNFEFAIPLDIDMITKNPNRLLYKYYDLKNNYLNMIVLKDDVQLP